MNNIKYRVWYRPADDADWQDLDDRPEKSQAYGVAIEAVEAGGKGCSARVVKEERMMTFVPTTKPITI